MGRTPLPNRRQNVHERIEWGGKDGPSRTWNLCIGFDRAGQAKEVFIDGEKQGSDYEGLLDDTCILMSILLQRGVSAASLSASIGDASPIGLVARRLAAFEGSA